MKVFSIRKVGKRKLTLKQERFVREYIKDGNATRAIRSAYPGTRSEGARRTMGAKLVTNANVSERIQEVLNEAGLTPELIVKELKTLITGDDKGEKNKAIKTAAEIMGLIGRGAIVATQINVEPALTKEDREYINRLAEINKNKYKNIGLSERESQE